MSYSIFLDFTLPNAPTWFYLSAILAVALFFKFGRILSLWNWDLLSLFLLVPGLLLLKQESMRDGPPSDRGLWLGYCWLLAGSGYFFLRCLLDLAIVRRPALQPNLSRGGLAWFMLALFLCLGDVAIREPLVTEGQVGKGSAVLEKTQKIAADILTETAGEPVDGRGTQFWVLRGLAGACHLAVIIALILIGRRHFQDLDAGMAAATLYLLLPYIAFHVTQVHHVWPTALLLWAIYFYRQPRVSGMLVGAAAGTLFFPALTLPVWLSFYSGRARIRFAAAFAFVVVCCLLVTGWLLWMEGELVVNVRQTMGLNDWQPWRGAPKAVSFWTEVHWAYRIPVFMVYAIFVTMTTFWPRPKNLGHLLALCAAVLIGIQFWYADGGVYVLWYLPLLLLLVFRPNLSDRMAPADVAKDDFVSRRIRALQGAAGWLYRRVRPPARASV